MSDPVVTAPARHHARAAYDAFAPHYDAFTAHHDYELWMGALEGLAQQLGLHGRRLLDVACGTGKSFEPFLARGYEVTATDVSPGMLRKAEQRTGGRARLMCHDMRDLPRLGEFDLVCCIDDAVNYLDTPEELGATLAGLERNLARDGVVVFDANTLYAYRSFFAGATVVRDADRVLVWDGQTDPDIGPGGAGRAELLAFERRDDRDWTCAESTHFQRHHPHDVVATALDSVGLTVVRTYGMHVDGSLDEGFDELANSKAVYIARRGAPEPARGGERQ
jgi:SAM-dependent methyltransferase